MYRPAVEHNTQTELEILRILLAALGRDFPDSSAFDFHAAVSSGRVLLPNSLAAIDKNFWIYMFVLSHPRVVLA